MELVITVNDIAISGIGSDNPRIEGYYEGTLNSANQGALEISQKMLYDFLSKAKRNSLFKQKKIKEPLVNFFDLWIEEVNQTEQHGGIGQPERLVNDVFEDNFAPWLGFSKNLVRFYMADRFQSVMSERAKALWREVIDMGNMRRRLADYDIVVTKEYIEMFPKASQLYR
jgi:hypothetical protein